MLHSLKLFIERNIKISVGEEVYASQNLNPGNAISYNSQRPLGNSPDTHFCPCYSENPELENGNKAPSAMVAANETGRVWGDPHFEGGDGGKYDVMGKNRKIL